MKLSDKISMAYRDVTNRKFRSFLTILAISIGTLLLVAMLGLGDGITKKFDDLISNFGRANEINIIAVDSDAMNLDTNNEDETNMTKNNKENKKLTLESAEKVSKIEGIDYTIATINSTISAAKIDNGEYVEKPINLTGVNIDIYDNFKNEVSEGKGLSGKENEILVSDDYLKKMDLDKKDIIGKKLTIKVQYPAIEGLQPKEPLEMECKIVGILKSTSYFSKGLVMKDKDVEKVLTYLTGTEGYISTNGYSYLTAYIKDDAKISKVCAEITKETELMTSTLEQMRTMISVVTNVVKALLSIAGIIVIIVAALGLVNTMTMTLQEKRKMIGVMRSVGASRGKIRIVFIFQSLMLGLSGGALGSLVAGIGIFIGNKWILANNSFKIGFSANNVIIAIAITLIIALLAGLIPSGRAAKLNVVEAVAEE